MAEVPADEEGLERGLPTLALAAGDNERERERPPSTEEAGGSSTPGLSPSPAGRPPPDADVDAPTVAARSGGRTGDDDDDDDERVIDMPGIKRAEGADGAQGRRQDRKDIDIDSSATLVDVSSVLPGASAGAGAELSDAGARSGQDEGRLPLVVARVQAPALSASASASAPSAPAGPALKPSTTLLPLPTRTASTDPPFSNLKHTQTNITGGSTGKPYSVFTDWQKWFIVVLGALGAIFSPISTNIYVPAIPLLATAFNVTEEKINLTVTMYLVFQALTPAIWASAGDCYGRRPIFIVCLLVYCLSCIGTALTPTSAYWLLMVLRMVQASGGSPLIAIGFGVIADVALPQERGRYVGIFNLGTTVGPALGPLLGGVFAFTLGWRSIFWFLAIFSGVVLVPMTFAFPETLRSLVGDGSIPPPLLNCTPAALLRRKRELREMQGEGKGKAEGETTEKLDLHRSKFRPWASFLLFLEPDIALIFTWASLYYAAWYGLLTVFSTIMKDQYGVNEIVLGLCYIPNGVACGLSGFLTGRIMDIIYRREKKRVGGDHRHQPDEFQLERVRFTILPFHVGLLLTSMIGLGWSVQARAPIAVPIVLNFFVGLGTGFLTTVTIYGIDLHPRAGGAVTATFNLIRCALGAVTVSTVQLITDRMGAGWCFVLLSGICLTGSPMIWVLMKWAPVWRKKRREKEKEELRKELDRKSGV